MSAVKGDHQYSRVIDIVYSSSALELVLAKRVPEDIAEAPTWRVYERNRGYDSTFVKYKEILIPAIRRFGFTLLRFDLAVADICRPMFWAAPHHNVGEFLFVGYHSICRLD